MINKRMLLYSLFPATFFTTAIALYVSLVEKNSISNNIFITLLFPLAWTITYILLHIMEQAPKKQQVGILREIGITRYFVLLVIMWLPWFFMCFPGNMAWDTGSSICFSIGADKGNVNNPCFQNLLFGLVYRFGVLIGNIDGAVFLYLVAQVAIYAFIFSYSLVIANHWRIPQWLIRCVLLFYGLCPIIPLYAFTIGKDSNFSIAIFAYCLMLLELIVEHEEFFKSRIKIVCLFVSCVAVGLLRNLGVYITIIGISSVIYLAIKDKWNRIRVLIMVLLGVILTNCITPILLQAPEGTIGENLSIPLQQTAYYFNNFHDEITAEEYAAITAVIKEECLEQYNPSLSDPVKRGFKNNASRDELSSYFQVWWKQFQKHPGAYFKALYYQTYVYFTPNLISNVKPDRIWGYHVSDRTFELTALKQPERPLLGMAKKIDAFAKELPILGIFQKVGIYSWILMMSLSYLLYQKKYRILVSVLPLIFVLIGCCCSPVNGYVRYALPLIVTVPLLSVLIVFAPQEAHHDKAQGAC